MTDDEKKLYTDADVNTAGEPDDVQDPRPPKTAKKTGAKKTAPAKTAPAKTLIAVELPKGTDLLAKVITRLVAANPKTPGTMCHPWFDSYRTGVTVAQYAKKAGRTIAQARGDVRWDCQHGYISLK